MAKFVPTYDLYGEQGSEKADFWVHCETIASRSRTHRWEIRLHRHDVFQQFLYIRTGSGDAIFDTEVVALAPPCFVSCRRGQAMDSDFRAILTAMSSQWRQIACCR